MSDRLRELDERHRRLVAEIEWQRGRLQAAVSTTDHWIRIARLVMLGVRRASRLRQYWNHSTQP
jgi:hypothetical protein